MIAALAMSGCATGSNAFEPHFGQPAIELARHVPACSKVRSVPKLSDHTASVATCVIDAHKVQFLSYANAAAANQPVTIGIPSADAHGDTWYASTYAADARLSIQRRIATQVANALHGQVSINRLP